MKKSIYFHIDEYNRDTIVAAGLFKKLGKEFNFFFGNRLDEFRLKSYDVFDVYIFPSLDKLLSLVYPIIFFDKFFPLTPQ